MDKIICIGKNYLEHAIEMGNGVPEQPILFLKPPSILHQLENQKCTKIELPAICKQGNSRVHHECEIVVQLKFSGKKKLHLNLSLEEAQTSIAAITLGLDMTLRDIQDNLKKKGHPWEIAKTFPGSALIAPLIPVHLFKNYEDCEFEFSLNGQLRQRGCAKQMRFSIVECIRQASLHFPLCDGDLLFTGTPAGVGPVTAGQTGQLKWGNEGGGLVDAEVLWL